MRQQHKEIGAVALQFQIGIVFSQQFEDAHRIHLGAIECGNSSSFKEMRERLLLLCRSEVINTKLNELLVSVFLRAQAARRQRKGSGSQTGSNQKITSTHVAISNCWISPLVLAFP